MEKKKGGRPTISFDSSEVNSLREYAVSGKYASILALSRAMGYSIPIVEREMAKHGIEFVSSGVTSRTRKVIDPALLALVESEGVELYLNGFGYNGLANRYNAMGFVTNPMEMSDLLKDKIPTEHRRGRGRPKGGSLVRQLQRDSQNGG
jgi:hypothetical protein